MPILKPLHTIFRKQAQGRQLLRFELLKIWHETSFRDSYEKLYAINSLIANESDSKAKKQLKDIRLDFIRQCSLGNTLCSCGCSGLAHIPQGNCKNCKVRVRKDGTTFWGCPSFKMSHVVAYPLNKPKAGPRGAMLKDKLEYRLKP